MKRITTILTTTILLLCLASHAQAKSPEAQHGPVVNLTRQMAWQKAVEKNLTILIAQMDKTIQASSSKAARTNFVPFVSFRSSYRDDPPIAASMVDRNRQLAYTGALNWSLPVGTDLSLSAGSTEFFSGAAFLPQPSTSIQLAITQALWRGGWGNGNQLAQRDLDKDIQRSVFVGQLGDFLLRVDEAYWALVIAQADVDIKKRSRDRARKQYEDTRENIRRKLLAEIEIYVPQENLVFFEQQLIQSEETLILARNRLSRLMLEKPGTKWHASDSLENFVFPEINKAQILANTFENHPRVQAQKLSLDQLKHQVTFLQNQTDPRFDLSGSFGFNGLEQDRWAAWSQALTAQNPEFRIGIFFEMPLDTSPNNARIEQARGRVKKQEFELRRTREQIKYDLHDALVQIQKRRQILGYNKKRIVLAEKKLQSEKEKYLRSLSTLANIALFQRDLDSAKIAERRARVSVILAYSRLRNIQGKLHTYGAVEVD